MLTGTIYFIAFKNHNAHNLMKFSLFRLLHCFSAWSLANRVYFCRVRPICKSAIFAASHKKERRRAEAAKLLREADQKLSIDRLGGRDFKTRKQMADENDKNAILDPLRAAVKQQVCYSH